MSKPIAYGGRSPSTIRSGWFAGGGAGPPRRRRPQQCSNIAGVTTTMKTVETTRPNCLAHCHQHPLCARTYFVSRDHCIPESRKRLKGEVSMPSRPRVALTKKNPAAACDSWEALERLTRQCPGRIQPRALRRNERAARRWPTRIACACCSLRPKTDNASDGRGRIASRRHADRQMAEHWLE